MAMWGQIDGYIIIVNAAPGPDKTTTTTRGDKSYWGLWIIYLSAGRGGERPGRESPRTELAGNR